MNSHVIETTPPLQQPSEPQLKPEISIEKYKNKLILDVEQDIILEKPKVSFSDIVGQEHAKRALQEHIILPYRYPQLFMELKRYPFRGIWIYGPSGTGKTLLVQACANEIDAPFFLLEAQDLLMRGPERAKQKIKKTLAAAKAAGPSFIYVDDIISLISETPTRKLSEAWRSFRNEYFMKFNCYSPTLLESNVKILITSQTPWLLEAYPRRKLIQKRIYVPLLDESARKDLLERQLFQSGQTSLSLKDQELLVHQTHGFSAIEIQDFVRRACYEPIREAQRSKTFKVCGELSDGAPVYQICEESDPAAKKMSLLEIPAKKLKLREVSRGDFERVWGQISPSTDELEILKYEEFTKEFGQEG